MSTRCLKCAVLSCRPLPSLLPPLHNPRRDAAGGRFVLKRTLLESSRLEKRVKELHADAEAAALSGVAAEAFSAAVRGSAEVSYLTGVIENESCSSVHDGARPSQPTCMPACMLHLPLLFPAQPLRNRTSRPVAKLTRLPASPTICCSQCGGAGGPQLL